MAYLCHGRNWRVLFYSEELLTVGFCFSSRNVGIEISAVVQLISMEPR